MTTEITKLNPEEFGLKEDQAATIEKAFMPKIIERNMLSEMYETVIKGDVTVPETALEARDLRLKLVKVRTGIAEIHRTQKAFYLAAGRFVDAWKNKETAPVEQMEEKLLAIEKYQENLERERKAALRAERLKELEKYEVDGSLIILGEMTEDVWQNYIAGVKVQYQLRKDAERKAEEERVAREVAICLHNERKEELLPYWQYVDMFHKNDLSALSDDDYRKLVISAKRLKAEDDAEQERIRKENEKLKKEREALEKKQAAERQKLAAEKAEAERKAKEAEAAMLAQAKKDREALEAARLEKERIEAEVKAKEEAAAKAAKDAEAARLREAKKAAAAPDTDKLRDYMKRLSEVELPVMKTAEAQAILNNVGGLLSKINAYIEEKIKEI